MKTIYEVTQRYCDNGKVTATMREIKRKERPLDYFGIKPGYDLYIDYFEDHTAALETLEAAKNA